MTSLGTIISYDRARRAGMLKPDAGGSPIVFTSADQQEFFPDPRPFERYSYSVLIALDGGQPRAINLRRQLTHREQAVAKSAREHQPADLPSHMNRDAKERTMDLNELLHAHQIEVMKASASADDNHFGMIAEYADRIRELRMISPADAVALDPAAPPTIIYGSYAGASPSADGEVALSQSADALDREDSENPDRGKHDRMV